MPSFDESYPGILAALTGSSGQPSATAEVDRFARLLGVALLRSVEERKAARAVATLRDEGLLDPETLAGSDHRDVADALRHAGVSLPAAAVRMLQRLAGWIVERHSGSIEAVERTSTDQLRDELIGLNGVGPPTADAILLLALDRPTYPVDRASYRILVRHGWLDPTADYEEARATLERPSGGDASALARLSAGMERIGRDYCRPSVARCESCPLRPFLPEGGPREPE
jgi:endonuclease-3 related protein